MSTTKYFFPGLWSFINRAAGSGSRDIHHLGRGRAIWHACEIHDSLTQIPKLDYEAQRALIAHALKVRESLVVTLRGIDEAIAEVVEKFDLYDKP